MGHIWTALQFRGLSSGEVEGLGHVSGVWGTTESGDSLGGGGWAAVSRTLEEEQGRGETWLQTGAGQPVSAKGTQEEK